MKVINFSLIICASFDWFTCFFVFLHTFCTINNRFFAYFLILFNNEFLLTTLLFSNWFFVAFFVCSLFLLGFFNCQNVCPTVVEKWRHLCNSTHSVVFTNYPSTEGAVINLVVNAVHDKAVCGKAVSYYRLKCVIMQGSVVRCDNAVFSE